jgi:hypothetical protein
MRGSLHCGGTCAAFGRDDAFNFIRDDAFCGNDGGWGGGAGVGLEVAGGDLEAVEEDAGALYVHLVGCEADEDVGEG